MRNSPPSRAMRWGRARLDYDILAYSLDRVIAGERFSYGASAGRYAPYVLSQLSGAYRDVPDFLGNQHRVTNTADADAYVARVEAFGPAIDAETERQREDAGRGVFAPDYILDTTLKQLASVRDKPAEGTGPAVDLAAKLKAANLPPDRAQAVARLMTERVFPPSTGNARSSPNCAAVRSMTRASGGCRMARPIIPPRRPPRRRPR
ncbi:hypothetical protein GCM10020258_35180 [Sphingomonas yabuuchiae]